MKSWYSMRAAAGGVARNPAFRVLLEDATGERVVVPQHPQLMGAYGAALLAGESALAG